MPKYLVTRYWGSSDSVVVFANSEEEAIEIANKDNDFTDDLDRTFLDETATLLKASPTGD